MWLYAKIMRTQLNAALVCKSLSCAIYISESYRAIPIISAWSLCFVSLLINEQNSRIIMIIYITSHHITSHHSSHHITPHHIITSHHIASHHITWYPATPDHITIIIHHITSYVISHHTTSHHIYVVLFTCSVKCNFVLASTCVYLFIQMPIPYIRATQSWASAVLDVTRYNDTIMTAMTSHITSLTIVCSTVYSGADQRKHQSSASLAFVRGIHLWPVNSPHKGPITRKMIPFDDVVMYAHFFFRRMTILRMSRHALVEVPRQQAEDMGHAC